MCPIHSYSPLLCYGNCASFSECPTLLARRRPTSDHVEHIWETLAVRTESVSVESVAGTDSLSSLRQVRYVLRGPPRNAGRRPSANEDVRPEPEAPNEDGLVGFLRSQTAGDAGTAERWLGWLAGLCELCT